MQKPNIEYVEYNGIDYGFGKTNIDHSTGIRFGVIPVHVVGQGWFEDAESEYGEAVCPKCGGQVVDFDEDEHGGYAKYSDYCCYDYACEECELVFDTQDCFPDEPFSHFIETDEYRAFQPHDDVDIFIEKSPYFTYAQFCSPCAPGACYLLSPIEGPHDPYGDPIENNRAYCFGPDWFEGTEIPYPIYSVETGKLLSDK